jgi:hypothetical protein
VINLDDILAKIEERKSSASKSKSKFEAHAREILIIFNSGGHWLDALTYLDGRLLGSDGRVEPVSVARHMTPLKTYIRRHVDRLDREFGFTDKERAGRIAELNPKDCNEMTGDVADELGASRASIAGCTESMSSHIQECSAALGVSPDLVANRIPSENPPMVDLENENPHNDPTLVHATSEREKEKILHLRNQECDRLHTMEHDIKELVSESLQKIDLAVDSMKSIASDLELRTSSVRRREKELDGKLIRVENERKAFEREKRSGVWRKFLYYLRW